MRLATGVWRLAFVAIVAAASGAGAQVQRDSNSVPAPPPAGPRTIVGIVADTSGNPVDSAEVRVNGLDRTTRTGSDGRFRINDVKPGTYSISARRLGFLPQVRRVVVGANGGSTSFSLVPWASGLPPSLTTVARGGLSGVVGDTGYKVVPGALVDVIGSGRRATTDSAGAFFVDVPPGRYMVRVTRDGFASQMLGVSVPNDSGQRVVFWLTPSSRSNGLEAFNAAELRSRLLTRSLARSRLFTHEDILRLNPSSTIQLATMGAVRAVDLRCEAIVDGGPFRVPLWSFDPEDISFFEVYTAAAVRVRGARGGGMQGISMRDCPTIYVWLRKLLEVR